MSGDGHGGVIRGNYRSEDSWTGCHQENTCRDADSSKAESELPDGLWLVDTGSGHDLITPEVADGYREIPVERVAFHTANGRIRTQRALAIHSNILQGEVQPYVLPNTPWVISVGKRG